MMFGRIARLNGVVWTVTALTLTAVGANAMDVKRAPFFFFFDW